MCELVFWPNNQIFVRTNAAYEYSAYDAYISYVYVFYGVDAYGLWIVL